MVANIRNALKNNENIIPVIGFELLPIIDNGIQKPYLDFMSSLIASDHNIPLPQNEYGFSLFNQVTHELLIKNALDKRITTEQISKYAIQIHAMVDKSYLEKIISVSPFNYFFNLTFTTHLSEVINEKRTFPNTSVIQSNFPFQSNKPKRPADLIKSECIYEGKIYNLYGLAYSEEDVRYDYYYTDDDILDFLFEFVKRFEIELKNYNEIVKESSLLFLGCQYPDWLIRILIKTLKPGSLDSTNRFQARIFFDYCNDTSNSFFLTKHQFRFQRNLNSIELVEDLFTTLSKDNYASNVDNKEFVFISYTRDNLTLVKKIVCQLAFHMIVWFDRIKMFPGSQINDEVKEGITKCKLFLPVITKESTVKNPNDYVRQEWIYYKDNFQNNPKVIPLVHKDVNMGQLGFYLSNEFSNVNSNLFYILIDDDGLTEQDIFTIKNKL